MKKAFFALFTMALTLLVVGLDAQVQTPAPSPASTLTQMVGLTEVKIEYSRPAKRDREIFGGLVPYGEVWRLGANAATKMTFTTDFILGGVELSAGSYAALAKPEKTGWVLMLYPYDSGNFGSYLEGDVEPTMVEVDATTVDGRNVESFMITIDEITSTGANIGFSWDDTYATVGMKVHTDEVVMASIDETLAKSDASANDYFQAAAYYASEEKDAAQALLWIDRSIAMGNEQFWVYRQKAIIQAQLGDKKGAIETAKKSMEMAKEAGNNDYIRMNEDSIKEWSM